VCAISVIPSEEEVSRRKLMSDTTMELARMGFAAWQQGDFATIEALLDPAVQWRWFEPGEWDCHGRQDVMDVIRERYEKASPGASSSSWTGVRIP